MSLEKIFETLDEESERQSAELIDKAKNEATRVIGEAEEESKKVVQNHIDKMNLVLRSERARIQVEIELERKRKIIKAKEEYASRVYSEVENHLKKSRDNNETYKKIIKNLLMESLNEVRGNKIVIGVDKKDENLVKSILNELNLNHEVKVEINCMGGITLHVDGKRITVHNTFESRLDKAQKVLKAQLTEVLFSA